MTEPGERRTETARGRPARPKRGQREGTIARLANGRYRARIMLDGERRSFYGGTRQEVLAQLDEVRRRYRSRQLADRRAERETLDAYLRRWLEGAGGRSSPGPGASTSGTSRSTSRQASGSGSPITRRPTSSWCRRESVHPIAT